MITRDVRTARSLGQRDLLKITGDARTAPALGMRDLLRSLEMRERRQRSGCAIYCNHRRCAHCASARDARSVAITGDARTAPAHGMIDLLRSLESANCASARDARSVEITENARTARALGKRDLLKSLDARTTPALGMRDLLRSLELRGLRKRSGCAIC